MGSIWSKAIARLLFWIHFCEAIEFLSDPYYWVLPYLMINTWKIAIYILENNNSKECNLTKMLNTVTKLAELSIDVITEWAVLLNDIVMEWSEIGKIAGCYGRICILLLVIVRDLLWCRGIRNLGHCMWQIYSYVVDIAIGPFDDTVMELAETTGNIKIHILSDWWQ